MPSHTPCPPTLRALPHSVPSQLCADEAVEDVVEGAELPGLQRHEHARAVRPLPPSMPPAEGVVWPSAVAVGDVVQLSYIGGWWDVQVQQILPEADPPQWVVKSLHFEATHTVESSLLRPQPVWTWHAPSTSWVPGEQAAAQ